MSFRESARPYFLDRESEIMSNKPGEMPDNNGLLYTGTYFVLLNRLGELKDSDNEHLRRVVDRCTPVWGLLYRHPSRRQHTAHDDYIGVSAAASIIGEPFYAKIFFVYGERHGWVYNHTDTYTLKQWFKSWFARLPGVVQHFKLCAGYKLSLFDQLWWALDIISTTRRDPDDTSGRILDWLKIQAYRKSKHNHWICNWAVDLWEADIRARYPRLMGDVFAVYFDEGHPFAKYMGGRL